MAAVLKISKEEVEDISLERVHRIGKSSPTDSKPGLPIAKFTYYNDKEFVVSRALIPKLRLRVIFRKRSWTKESFSYQLKKMPRRDTLQL